MLRDARKLSADADLRAHVCIVGAGAAGITTALELARGGLDVLLLEAGGTRAERAAEQQLAGVIAPASDHEPLELLSQRRLGGTTHVWGGRCAPMDPVDLRSRPWVAHSGWPLGPDELAALTRRAHAWCELGDYAYSASAALGSRPGLFDPAGDEALDVDRLWRYSAPIDFWRRHRRELTASPRVTVVAHARVGRLERDALSGRIDAAVVCLPGRELRARADAYLIAAGGLETARLLLASDRESPAGIGNEHGLVGRFYGSHLVGEVGAVTVDRATAVAGATYHRSRDGVWCRRHVALTAQTQERHELRNLVLGLWHPDPRDPGHGDPLLSTFALARAALARSGTDWKSRGVKRPYADLPDVAGHLGNVGRGLPSVTAYGAIWLRWRWLARRRLPGFAAVPRAAPLRLRIDAEQAPDPDNRVTLSRDRDALGIPRLEVHHRIGRDDLESIARSLQLAAIAIGGRGAGEIAVPDVNALEASITADGTHQMGVARMADSPREGVVDRECRVHGAANLHVAGGATFPTTGAVAPTLTVVALALHAADAARRAVKS